jgi:2-polyprenyl-6-hydroxyphenyl methylase / 3-demethylubiquinone-9 3-methyltransferase
MTQTHPTAKGTASEEDVARFTSIAANWWDPHSEFAPLHAINPARLSYMVEQLTSHFGLETADPRPLAGLRLLDIGCGGGLLCEPLAELGADVTGIDAGRENIEAAKAHAREQGLEILYRQVLPEQFEREKGSYDVVINMEVIEHVTDVDRFLAAAAALLRPGGAMLLSTLNRTLKSLALAKIGAEYILRWVPAGTHNWNQFVQPSELAAGLRANGVEIKDLRGLVYNPVNGKWQLSRDLAVNYLAYAVKAGG